MAKHNQTIQTILRLLPTNCLSVFEHFVGVGVYRIKKRIQINEILTHFSIINHFCNVTSKLLQNLSLLKGDSGTGVSCEFCEIFKKTFSYRTPLVDTSVHQNEFSTLHYLALDQSFIHYLAKSQKQYRYDSWTSVIQISASICQVFLRF